MGVRAAGAGRQRNGGECAAGEASAGRVVYLRVPDFLFAKIQANARKRGMKHSEYLRYLLIKVLGEPEDSAT